LRTSSIVIACCLIVARSTCAFAQQSDAADLEMRQTSGTAVDPGSGSMPMEMTSVRDWTLMLHGVAFINHVNESGFRGHDQNFSTNWVMGMASRPLWGGTLMLRSMLSLEPATITGRRYPELFQTGETAFGKQLIDAQHPHNFFMELAAEYARQFGGETLYVYAAPVGDPALGPVAFPHRSSAMELPQAALSHHLQDSTHISFNVVTTGIAAKYATFEVSAFHGGEPDERRWIIESGPIDSWAARLQLHPFKNMELQVSHGHLTKPELIEPGYQSRTTASASYSLPFERFSWHTTAVWGRVYKEVHDQSTNAYLAETALQLFDIHHLTARAEVVDKDELFFHPILATVPRPPLPARVFLIHAYTAGYTIDLLRTGWTRTGVGANVTWYRFPPILNGFYGEHPHSVLVFIRARLGGKMEMDHMHM
jgi:hypothetical protein